MQHMMRTTGTLSELAPSFEKPRSDARTGQHDKTSEAERAAAKKAFGNLVKKSDDEPENASKPEARPENAKSLPDPRAGIEPMKGQEPRMPQSGIGDARSLLGQAKTGLQERPTLTLPAAAGNRAQRDVGTALSDGQISGPDTVSPQDQTKAPSSAEKVNVRLPSIAVKETDLPSAQRMIANGNSAGSETQHGRGPVVTEVEIPTEEPKLRDRKLDGIAATQLDVEPLSSGEGVSSLDEARNESGPLVDTERLASDVDDQLDSENVSEQSDRSALTPMNVIGLISQPNQVLNQVSASLQKVAGQSMPIGEPGPTPAMSHRAERSVRLVSEAVAGRSASELSASSAMPELRARLATETATAQRALSMDDRALEIENNVEADSLNGPVRVVKQEGHVAPAPDLRVGPTPVFGQLVQSIASTDGLPKLGSEVRLLASQNSASLTPEPLKVLHIQLQPRELGDLAVRIALRGDKIELVVQTQRQATANLLMSDQRLLVEALQQRNLDVDSVTIQVVEPDRGSSGQSAGLPHPGQGKSGQSEAFLSGSQGQTSREDRETDTNPEALDRERQTQQQDRTALDEFGRRRGVYL